MIHHRSRKRLVGLLFLSTIATYVLIALGTAVSTTGSAGSCTTWPGCESAWAIGPVTGDLTLYVAHRAAALVAGVLLVATGLLAYRLGVDRITAGGIATALILFPIQVGVGATLVGSGSSTIGALHLLLAMTIFVGLLVALARTLEVHVDDTHDVDAVSGVDDAVESVAVNGPTPSTTAESHSGSESVGTNRSDAGANQHEPNHHDAVSAVDRYRITARAYFDLTKPKLMWLLCLVAVAGMGLATTAGYSVHLETAVATLVGGVLAIGAAGAFNQVYERDRDERMERTDDRPLVHDRVPARNAYAFVAVLTVSSTAVMLTWVNVLATILTLAAVAYYAILYTVVLKPNTAWNTVLGGGAGAIPALIGWAAVTGGIDWPAVVLAAVIFLWTPAHFYSFAIAYRDDYARGGFPMLPVVAGDLVARRHIIGYLGATMLAVSVLGWIVGLGLVYVVGSVALGVVFLRSVVRQYSTPTRAQALRSFYVSNAYLGVILLAIAVESGLALV
ncbi:heme o synthase [Halovivax gelatinilyticus]|uniref:heme o synthase n=1 Tax=Halovivax gelatinilyticus TaxID=2961597 RepID=UPI0020CA9898|nr:heme o synthase [Halovivax gelatinilyticus]